MAKIDGHVIEDEPLQLGGLGLVAEGTTFNIFMVRERILATPPVWTGLLEGVSRGVVWEAAQEAGIPLHEVPLTRMDFYNADEVFITNTSMEIMPVSRVDGRRVGGGFPGPSTRKLQSAFRALVWRECGVLR